MPDICIRLTDIVAVATVNSTVVGFLLIGNTTVSLKLQLVVRALFQRIQRVPT